MILPDLILGGLALLVLVLPGWLVTRTSSVTAPLLAGFVLSVIALVGVVLAFDAAAIRLTRGGIGGAWGLLVVAATAFWLVKHRRRSRSNSPSPIEPAPEGITNWIVLLPLVPVSAVVIWRACAQPLFGVDTVFRWNYLAEQMLARRSLGFYPPVTAADYEIYSWPDGIAPTASSLYYWIYNVAGAARPELTAALLIFQFALVLLGVHALSLKLFSPQAAAYACALIACSPVIPWATIMGHETGLMAIAVLALLVYLPQSREDESTATIIIGGAAAGMGALAREYGLVLIPLGFALCLVRKLSLQAAGVFLTTAIVCAVPWYLRNWIHTGNPLFNLAIGGWFPVNPVHAWLNESFQLEFGWAHLPAEAPRLLVVNCIAALLGGVVGAWLFARKTGSLIITIACVVCIWIWSLGYTAAGFIYSLRVLNPALALAAVLGGAAIARWVPARFSMGIAVLGLCLISADSALRTLTMPANVYRVPLSRWLTVGGAVHEYHQRPIYREFVRVAGTRRILVLGPNALLATLGARTVPLWSPEVRFLFDSSLPPDAIARRLQAINIGFALFNSGEVNARFLAHSDFFRDPLGTLRPVWSDDDMVFLQIHAAAASE